MNDKKLKEIEKAYAEYVEKRNMQEIPMPVYFWEDEETKEKHYDFEEMADELGTRIKETLNINVVVIIEEFPEEEE